MKRSFIDARIDAMLALCERHGFKLPPFALWSLSEFRSRTEDAKRIRARGLGWNIAEFKPGAFATDGIAVFTTRMGDWRDLNAGRGRLYGEKAIMAMNGQRTPAHYHIVKTEDIVNRGGGRFIVELCKVDRTGRRLDEPFDVVKDASLVRLGAGGRVSLEPGESLVLEPFVAHSFWAEGGEVLAGEVSLANDDTVDNYFLPALEPPDAVQEDASARYVTVQDIAALLA